MRNTEIARVCCLMLAWCLPMLSLSANAAPRKPNVVFILVDDLGWNDLSGEGSTFYESPNIDSIAARGMKFTRGYAACQVCSPSRASILTGKYTPNHGITNYLGAPAGEAWRKFGRNDSHLPPPYAKELNQNEVTIAEAFKAAGYKTFFAGKWHLGQEGSLPTDHGFDINIAGSQSGGPYAGGYFSPYNMPSIEDGPAGESLTLRLGQETANFIMANKDEPFFAYLSFYAVHAPIQTTPALWNKYRDKAEAQGLTQNNSRFKFDRRLPVRQVQDCPIYAGMVETMDAAVGTVLKALKDNGLDENTIVCFTSDNGGVSSGDAYSTSCLPLRGGKGRQWEGGIREPYYIIAPGMTKAGSISDTPVHGIDWYPTLMDLAGLQVPAEQQVDGESLVPLIKGNKLPADRLLYWHYPHYGNQGGEPSSIIMGQRWKLIYYHEDGRYELYDLQNDPGEQTNVASKNAEILQIYKDQLQLWLKQTHATFPTEDPKFEPAKREEHWQRMSGELLEKLEKEHARYLSKDFKPNKDWWGSVQETKD